MTKILITGAAGFLGSHLADDLVRKGHTVLGIDNFATGKKSNPQEKFDLANCDITDWFGYLGEFHDFEPEVVIHLAAQSAISVSRETPSRDAHVNVMGTMNTILAAKKVGVGRIIFTSTSAVYYEDAPNPLIESSPLRPDSIYGVSKLAAENYIQLLLPDSVILRLGNVYGPRQVPIGGNQVIPLMIQHLLKEDFEFSINGDGNQSRDFIYVDDVVDAIERTAIAPAGIYNIATGHATSVNSIAYTIGDLIGKPDYNWPHNENNDARRHVVLHSKLAEEKFYWFPQTNLADGLRKTIEWWKS